MAHCNPCKLVLRRRDQSLPHHSSVCLPLRLCFPAVLPALLLCSCRSYSRTSTWTYWQFVQFTSASFYETQMEQLQQNPSPWLYLLSCLFKIACSPKVMEIVSMQVLCCITHDQYIMFKSVFANVRRSIMYVTFYNSLFSLNTHYLAFEPGLCCSMHTFIHLVCLLVL